MKYFTNYTPEDAQLVKEAFLGNLGKKLVGKFSVEGRLKNQYADLAGKLPGVKDGRKIVDDYIQPVRETLKKVDMKQKGNLKDKILTKMTGTTSMERNLKKGVDNVQRSYATSLSQEAKHMTENAAEYLSNPKKVLESFKAVASGGRGNLNANRFIKERADKAGSFLGTNKRKAKKLKKGVTWKSTERGLDDIIKKDRVKQVKGVAGATGAGVVGTGAWAVNRNANERKAKRELIRQMMARRQGMAQQQRRY